MPPGHKGQTRTANWARLLPGLALSALIAVASLNLGGFAWFQEHGLSPMTLAIILGILIGNSIYPRIAPASGPGVAFSKTWLLRVGVVLYGMRLTGQDIGHVGVAGVAVDAVMVTSTFLLATYVGTRWLGLDRKTALLIATGNSICGAAAVMAAEPIVRGKAEQVTVAVATVVVFGTFAIFLYPFLFDLNQNWHIISGGARGFGLYTGSTVHEVAQVIAAARPIGQDAADTAVIAKMVRVMMLAPMLLGLSWWLAREKSGAAGHHGQSHHDEGEAGSGRIAIPWFALAFIAAVGFNSLQLLPHPLVAGITVADGGLLAMAMAALGLTTHASSIRKAGFKPLVLALILFAWLIAGGALVNHWLAGA